MVSVGMSKRCCGVCLHESRAPLTLTNLIWTLSAPLSASLRYLCFTSFTSFWGETQVRAQSRVSWSPAHHYSRLSRDTKHFIIIWLNIDEPWQWGLIVNNWYLPSALQHCSTLQGLNYRLWRTLNVGLLEHLSNSQVESMLTMIKFKWLSQHS